MFDGLDTIDWATLHGAYGPAGEVPALIRGLASRDGDAAVKARRLLEGWISHQGTTYSASPPVVPFLAELPVDGATRHRGGLARMLGEMVARSPSPSARRANAGPCPGCAPGSPPITTTDPADWHRWGIYLLAAWGASAAPAVSKLRSLLDTNLSAWALDALTAIGPAAAPVLPRLRAALTGPPIVKVSGNVRVTHLAERIAVLNIDADPDAALDAARAALKALRGRTTGGFYDLPHDDAVTLLDALGDHGRETTPSRSSTRSAITDGSCDPTSSTWLPPAPTSSVWPVRCGAGRRIPTRSGPPS